MKIGFLLDKIDEDIIKFLSLINYETVIFEKSKEFGEYFPENNIKIIKTLNFENAIKQEDVKILFVDKNVNFKSNYAINIKIVENELERYIFDYDFYAIRNKKIENCIYFPYFIDFDFFSNFKSKFKKFDRIKRITILTNSFDATLISILEKLMSLKKEIKNLYFIVYQVYSEKTFPFVNFISRELSKTERAELFLNSSLIISIENRKKEVLEAMAMKRIAITNDGFANTLKINFDKLLFTIKRALDFVEYEVNKIVASEYDIKKSAKIFENEIKDFIEINSKI
ncbi:MAG: hypothetical protein QXT34_00580 [Candidatus Aenigmatarchaeota archaeon]